MTGFQPGCRGEEPVEPVPAAAGQAPQRIISTAPNLTEILFAVGAGDQVAAVTDFCAYPPEKLAQMPRIGAYLNPDMERMFSLQPDLVVVIPSMESLRRRLEAAHIPTLTVRNESHEDMLASIEAIGTATGHEAEGQQLRAELEQGLAKVRDLAGTQPTSFLMVIGRGSGDMSGIFAVGPGTFLDELARAAGGRNVLEEAISLYPQVPLEEVIHLAPEVIIEVVVPPSELTGDQVAAGWNTLSTVPAVRDGRVHVLTDDYMLIPGPRALRTAERLLPLLHPETTEEPR